jgi:hypothetical protein
MVWENVTTHKAAVKTRIQTKTPQIVLRWAPEQKLLLTGTSM